MSASVPTLIALSFVLTAVRPAGADKPLPVTALETKMAAIFSIAADQVSVTAVDEVLASETCINCIPSSTSYHHHPAIRVSTSE
jgi:hypothetical protein